MRLILSFCVFALLVLAWPVRAQDLPENTTEADAPAREIIVTAPRIAGSVETEIPPDLVLDADAVDAYGASNVAELVAALSTQTRTGRGRGGGMPVVLVNGRRVAGFSEIRDLPPEAIQRVETFPEEVALRFGYSADQRVINFILKPDFAAITAETEFGAATSGARHSSELQAGFLKIGKKGRVSLNAEYERDSAIRESERGIVQPVAGLADARTLLPKTGAWDVNGVIKRSLGEKTEATLNLTYDRDESLGLFGLSVPAQQPLERDRLSQSATAGVTLDGGIGSWRWTATGTYGVDTVRTLTDTLAGPTAAPDTARSRLTTANGNLLLAGTVARLPAGPVTATFRAGYERRGFRSRSVRGGGRQTAMLARNDLSVRVSLDVPLASRNRNVAAPLGDLSLNINGGYRRLSDFGGINSFGYGLNWEPIEGLSLLASLAAEEAAPSQQQLRDPLVFTPNVTVFDFVRGQSAVIEQISGGNPGLRAEDRRDVKLAASLRPKSVKDLTLSAEYYRNRAQNPISSFPVLTPAIEAAFPGRIVRNGVGVLTAIDVRAVNYFASKSDELRLGLNFNRAIGPQGPAAGMRGGGGRSPSGTGSPPGSRGGGMGGGRFGGGPGKRVQASLTYTRKLADAIRIAPGQPLLDLLDGGATGATGGTSGHRVDLNTGWYDNGFGLRVEALWQSGSVVRDGAGKALRFSPLSTANLRLFLNFDQRKNLIKAVPFLKGSRIFLRTDNVTNDIRKVRDASGSTPFRFLPGYIDPLGRTIVLGFRKIF